jgi:hypothetical protein
MMIGRLRDASSGKGRRGEEIEATQVKPRSEHVGSNGKYCALLSRG